MAEPKVLTFASRDEWLAGRKDFITASDVAAILGFDAKRQPLSVWMEKRGLVEPSGDDPAKKAGRKLERTVVEWYADETGYEVTHHQHVIECHPDLPWFAVSPDATAVTAFKDRRNVEAKCANAFMKTRDENDTDRYGEAGTDQVPRRNIVQAQAQMAVRGMDVTDQPVLIGGYDFRIYYLPIDRQFVDFMIRELVKFRELLSSGTPPALDYAHGSALDLVQRMYRGTDAEVIEIEPEFLPVAKKLEQARDYSRKLDKYQDEAKARFLDRLGNATRARIKGTDVEIHRNVITKNFKPKPASTRTEIHLKVKGLPDDETSNGRSIDHGQTALASAATD